MIKIGHMSSCSIIINTGTPQGCPISPKLYSLFTFDCKAHYTGNHVFKFADDTTVSGLISDNNENNYRREIDDIVSWCDTNNLFLNVSKTKELIIDFRRNQTNIEPVTIVKYILTALLSREQQMLVMELELSMEIMTMMKSLNHVEPIVQITRQKLLLSLQQLRNLKQLLEITQPKPETV